MKLTIGFSPCPNDTFIFDALVHHKIDTEGLEFSAVLADVEELNRRAATAELDVTKLSYAAYPAVGDHYVLLHSGSAIGRNCGPILIAANGNAMEELADKRIAIPGRHTTANLLLSLAFPKAKNKKEMVFSEIEEAVLKGQADAGVIIHESRFTYLQKGLKKIIDLGEWWEEQTGLPLPLGGIAVKRHSPADVQQKVNRLVRRSVEHALAYPMDSLEYVKANAQEMEEDVMQQHIKLYVNDFSVDLGEEGKNAVKTFFDKTMEAGTVPAFRGNYFVT